MQEVRSTTNILEPLVTVVEVDSGAFTLVGPSLAFASPNMMGCRMSEHEVTEVLSRRFGFSEQTVRARIEVAKLQRSVDPVKP
jgi:hypothetical protein